MYVSQRFHRRAERHSLPYRRDDCSHPPQTVNRSLCKDVWQVHWRDPTSPDTWEECVDLKRLVRGSGAEKWQNDDIRYEFLSRPNCSQSTSEINEFARGRGKLPSEAYRRKPIRSAGLKTARPPTEREFRDCDSTDHTRDATSEGCETG